MKRVVSIFLFVIILINIFSPCNALAVETVKQKRYTVLVLDTTNQHDFSQYDSNKASYVTIYTAPTAIEYVKKAASHFLDNISISKDDNYVAIVSYTDNATIISDFSKDFDKLNQSINNLYPVVANPNIASGLQVAESLLNSVSSQSTKKNVVLISTGMTYAGDYHYNGPYNESTVGSNWRITDTQVKLYAFANHAYDIATNIKKNGSKIYSIGFFQTMEGVPVYGQNIAEFFRIVALDLASSKDYFFSVDDPDKLIFTFGEVADDIISNLEERDFINQHIDFIDSSISDIYENCFSNTSDYDTIKTDAILGRIWDSIKDLGEIVTFKVSDLQITADYYEVFLSDVLMAMTKKTDFDELEIEANSYYTKGLGLIEKVIDSGKTDADISFEIDESAFRSSYELSKDTKDGLSVIFKNAYKNHPKLFQDIFQGLDCADEIVSYIGGALDICNAFITCYNAYCISMAIKEVNKYFFEFCNLAAGELEKSNKKYSEWFRNAIQGFEKNASSDKDIYTATKAAIELGNTSYELLLKDVIKATTAKMISNLLGCAIGKVLAVIEAWNVGTWLADQIAGNDTESLYYMNYISPVELAMQKICKNNAETLKKNNSFQNAKIFDMSFNILKQTNIALYNTAFNYANKWHIFAYKSAAQKQQMADATYYKNLWQNYYCHKNDFSEDYSSYQTILICCPVDVYLYDLSGNRITVIENEEVTFIKDKNIAINVFNGQKCISYPIKEQYSIQINARDNGEMDYMIYTDSESLSRQVEFYNISLKKGQSFTGSIPNEINTPNKNIILNSNGKNINANYDSFEADTCIVDGHVFSSWSIKKDATSTEEGKKIRTCSRCGKEEFRTIEKMLSYGDVNGDQMINGKDSTLLLQYLADWDVEINMDAADVNGDDRVDGKDATLLLQYLADWDVILGK